MPTVGQYLRELREQRKMSVEEVSRATPVNATVYAILKPYRMGQPAT